MAEASESGNEIVPLNSETQIALPLTGDESLVAPTHSEAVIAGGSFVGAVIGPQTNKKVLKANDYTNAKITHHHHYYPTTGGSEESSTSAPPQPKKKREETQDIEEGYVSISDDIFMCSKEAIKKGTHVYNGYQQHASGKRRKLAIKAVLACEDKHVREVECLLKLAYNPNVVQIIQSKEQQGPVRILYIAMELCLKNLQDYFDENCKKNVPFNFQETMLYAEQLVTGMKHIHSNGIVHRDLKPENVLLSMDRKQIKVTDFGISRQLRPGKSKTKVTSYGQGTDGYQAPETYESDVISPCADIFSLGLVLYSLFSNGQHAFGNNVRLRSDNIINNKGRDLSGLLVTGDKKRQLLDLLEKVLQCDPRLRPTIEEVSQHPFFSEMQTEQMAAAIVQLQLFETSRSVLAVPEQDHSAAEDTRVKEVGISEETSSSLQPRAQSSQRRTTEESKLPSKEGIVIFDKKSENLQLLNPTDNTLKQLETFNEDKKNLWSDCTAVTLDEYIYVLMKNKSVLRLNYSDGRATWEQLQDMIIGHGCQSPTTVMSGCIYVAGGGGTNIVEKFDPSSSEWSSVEEKKLSTYGNAFVLLKGFMYSIAGSSDGRGYLNEVERFDPFSSTWSFVAPMKRAQYYPTAVEFNGKIFVLGGCTGSERLSSVEIYDASANTWSLMKNEMLKPRYHFSAFVIDGDIYAVGGDDEENSIERYRSERDDWEEVQIQTKGKIYISASTKIPI